MNPKKDDDGQPTENMAKPGENLSGWADQVAQAAQSMVDGLNAAVCAESQKESIQKAKPTVKPE
jgi:hypothetical protein